jgi:hypothetical protein
MGNRVRGHRLLFAYFFANEIGERVSNAAAGAAPGDVKRFIEGPPVHGGHVGGGPAIYCLLIDIADLELQRLVEAFRRR